MPALPRTDLLSAISDAIHESGFSGGLITSPLKKLPARFAVVSQNGNEFILTVYAWTLTHGGGAARPTHEYRIQMTSVESPLQVDSTGVTILIGYEPELQVFAGFDLRRHRTFTTGSPSIQIDIRTVRQALQDGLAFSRKSNDEIAVGIRS
ncbi:MAG: HNH endonuclease, partial [Terriglobia bacterium]